MVFSSPLYILFLFLTVCLYWTLPQKYRTPLLLAASYIFYMAWSPPFGVIYAPVIFLDSVYFYYLSVAMVKWPQHSKKIMIFGITTELLLLGYFKYANFAAQSIEGLLQAMNFPAPDWQFNVFLPLAISFTNFVLISYLVDVYRGDEKPDPSFVNFATYVAFFPHLIAGPIVRAKELLHQLSQRHQFSNALILKGIDVFLCGVLLKVMIADSLSPYVDFIFNNPQHQGFDSSWVGIYSFAVQIFCDFAGYTLMAQGSAIMMGLTLPDNFNAPYFSRNIQDFWRRWHMSLSRWLRDYLYIPLGGNRGGKFMTYRNLFLTMGIGGLWHGANWTFVVWGLYQGLLLSLHRACEALKINRLAPGILATILTFHMVCIGWVFFRAQTFPQAFAYLASMFNPMHMADLMHNPMITGGKKALITVVLFFIGHIIVRTLGDKFKDSTFLEKLGLSWTTGLAKGVAYAALFYMCLTIETQGQAFIYFQF